MHQSIIYQSHIFHACTHMYASNMHLSIAVLPIMHIHVRIKYASSMHISVAVLSSMHIHVYINHAFITSSSFKYAHT